MGGVGFCQVIEATGDHDLSFHFRQRPPGMGQKLFEFSLGRPSPSLCDITGDRHGGFAKLGRKPKNFFFGEQVGRFINFLQNPWLYSRPTDPCKSLPFSLHSLRFWRFKRFSSLKVWQDGTHLRKANPPTCQPAKPLNRQPALMSIQQPKIPLLDLHHDESLGGEAVVVFGAHVEHAADAHVFFGVFQFLADFILIGTGLFQGHGQHF